MSDPFDLIWTGRSLELVEMGALELGSWMSATQTDMIRYVDHNAALKQSRRGQPYPSLCAVMMVKDEGDIIGHNIRHLHQLGFCRLVILDNGSRDQTTSVIRELRNSLQGIDILIVDDISIAYMQSNKATALMRLASAFWSDLSWIFPVDADEFLCAEGSLSSISSIPTDVDVLVVQKVNHYLLPETIDLTFGDVLGRMPVRTHLGVQPPKIAVRPMPDVVITQGNHDVRSTAGRQFRYAGALEYGFYYREFQNRSFEQFKRKVINGGRAVLAAEKSGAFLGGDHWKHWFSAYEQKGDDGLREVFLACSIKPSDELRFDPILPAFGMSACRLT